VALGNNLMVKKWMVDVGYNYTCFFWSLIYCRGFVGSNLSYEYNGSHFLCIEV